MDIISAVFTEGRVAVPALNEANSLYQDGYGSFLGDGRLLTLKPYEALYLVEMARIAVVDEEKRVSLVFQELLGLFSSRDSHIWIRYIVYRDLRSRGFVVREGRGLGVDFQVYERGAYGKKQPRYLVYGIWEGSPESMKQVSEVLDSAEDDGQILRLAVIDRRGEVVYYTLSEMVFNGED